MIELMFALSLFSRTSVSFERTAIVSPSVDIAISSLRVLDMTSLISIELDSDQSLLLRVEIVTLPANGSAIAATVPLSLMATD